ncbi:MAG: GDSL-type esterase/lipase family protein [Prevotellaceae bacterium]|jgi:hypothetical protein|nr:GDSL-type esterase/lipase family protein [Prevotellaceae bacterium]
MNRTFLLTILLNISLITFSQANINTDNYKFINLKENYFKITENDSSVINNFFAKIKNIYTKKDGKVNILHIGGSHVQAGVFPEAIRQNLDFFNRELTPARGYVFPYRVAKTNNPAAYDIFYDGKWEVEKNVKRNYNVKLGVGGIAVYTDDKSAEISVKINNLNDLTYLYFEQIKLLGYVEDGEDWAVMPVVKLRNRVVYPNYDYVDTNFYTFDLKHPENSFTVYFQQFDTVPHKFVLTGFVLENDRKGIVYHSVGVNGAAVSSYLNCEHFEEELSIFPPDMVIFGIGINDWVDDNMNKDKFIENYNLLINRIKRVSPDCAFIFITNNDSYHKIKRKKYAVNTNGTKAQAAFYELARQNGGAVWDQFAIMGGLQSMKKWQDTGLARKDKIHFTFKGYKLLGNLFFDAFLKYYNEIEN